MSGLDDGRLAFPSLEPTGLSSLAAKTTTSSSSSSSGTPVLAAQPQLIDNSLSFEDDLAMFTNASFFDFDLGETIEPAVPTATMNRDMGAMDDRMRRVAAPTAATTASTHEPVATGGSSFWAGKA